MKRIFSLFTLLAFFIIGGFHNSMIVFAEGNEMKMGIEDNNDNNCLDLCCIELIIDHGIAPISGKYIEKKVFKIIDSYISLEYKLGNLYSVCNKNLIKKTSPPYLKRNISNYYYHTLIKVIKSNT